MIRTVLLSTQAHGDYDALDPMVRHRVKEGLLRLAKTGRGDVKKLKGVGKGADLYRLRIGGIRIVFGLTPTELQVTRIFPRSKGYEWL